MTDSDEEDSNKQPHVELPIVPNDNALRNAALITSTSSITLNMLKRENQKPSNKKYLDAMLLQIIPPAATSMVQTLGLFKCMG
eukprot:4600852-Ditylum_brightwellii.AAC.1